MKRKDFLKITSGLALSLVSRGWAGVGSSLLSDGPRSSSGVPKKGFLGESRRLGGLEVSSIGLGSIMVDACRWWVITAASMINRR